MAPDRGLERVATCAAGLEELLKEELAALGCRSLEGQRGAVTFTGGWVDVWRCNWRLRIANRVLVKLGEWAAPDGDALAAGAGAIVGSSRSWGGLSAGDLFHPSYPLAVRATSRVSEVRDPRWVALRVKDGVVDAQRVRWGRRASVDRHDPDLPLRVLLDNDRATLLLDTSGQPLDRRSYRLDRHVAPLRENLAAACVLASGWDGRGPVVDPMCGAGTLLVEAAAFAMGSASGALRQGWSFERLAGFDGEAFRRVRAETIPAPGPDVQLYGVDHSSSALKAARANLDRAGLSDRLTLVRRDTFAWQPPSGPGLVVLNPPYGERFADSPEQWREIGDLLKQHYRGWRAVVIAGDPGKGKHIGLRPSLRLPVRNGKIEARILRFELY